MCGTFKSARSGEKLFEGFEAALESDPIVVIAIGAADAKGKGFGGAGYHGSFLIFVPLYLTRANLGKISGVARSCGRVKAGGRRPATCDS